MGDSAQRTKRGGTTLRQARLCGVVQVCVCVWVFQCFGMGAQVFTSVRCGLHGMVVVWGGCVFRLGCSL